MKTKTFKHHTSEICNICKKIIDTGRDNWCVLIDYRGEKEHLICFYHNICLNDLINGKAKLMEKNFRSDMNKIFAGVMKQVQPMIQQMSSNTKEHGTIYDIKT